MTATACPGCAGTDARMFHEQRGVPIHSCLLLPTLDEARKFPRSSLRLALCGSCGFIWNTEFDPSLQSYSSQYEETQGFSPRFRSFARELAERWVDRYGLRGKKILEIGCGKGEFLELMCEAGGNRGVGIDPAYVPGRLASETAGRIEFIQDFYSEKYGAIDADALVCRHTLEHISPVGEFMRTVRRALGDRTETIVLFELPDVMRVLREVAFWDVYYEHCSYFTLGSLARLFRATGFEVLDLSLDYDDQYVLIEAVPAAVPAPGEPLAIEADMAALRAAVDHYEASLAGRIESWRTELNRASGAGQRTVVWGSGSKGVAYLTALGIQDQVEYVVDINPFKQGKFMAGTGQEIVAPEFLAAYKPELVIAMNPIYAAEIQRSLDEVHVAAQLIAV